MGEGVTNPTESAVEGPSVFWAACLKLVLLLGLSYVVALRWKQQRREAEVKSDAAREEDSYVNSRGEKPTTSLTGNTGPHLRRSVSCGIVSQIQSVTRNMEPNTSVSSDPQPDSFFTWDSGGNSGDYSFVHTAVELPKYPDGAITEEERQMLLLYMQSGHPELLLSATNSSLDGPHSVLGPPPPTENPMCDQTSVRGFLETIVEENSDDLKSPSDCDENSVGWGSWDESDDDRVTVVEMETTEQNPTDNGQCGVKRELEDQNSVLKHKFSKREKFSTRTGYNLPEVSGRQNIIPVAGNRPDDSDLPDKQLVSLSGASSVNNCAFENSAVGRVNATGDNSAEHSEVSEHDIIPQSEFLLDTNPKVSLSSVENSDFESLWISANNFNSPNAEPINPWCKNEINFIPSPPDIESVDFGIKNCNKNMDDSTLLELGPADLCLVPSGASTSSSHTSDEKLTFSDDFKDYFLPVDTHVPAFNRNDKYDDMFVTENMSNDPKVRCFRIGFESEPLEIINNSEYCNAEKVSPTNSEAENSESNDLQQETLFSPRDGDVVYGSSWLGGHAIKTPEKSPSSAETRFSTVHSESPPSDNSRQSLHLFDQSASDDELQQVPNSLSRWQHHTDLQHVQEATSPITRWQHQTDLTADSNADQFSKQTFSDEDTDDGLPAQLKEIYSSFKMKDNKMGRIKIKDDKLKKLGLWDNDKKVTLPPFMTSNEQGERSRKDLIREEELDDLELDMFSVNKKKLLKSTNECNADAEIDDALKSFNHLDDYSSNSEDNSESENSYTVNTVENVDYENEDLSNPSTPDTSILKNEVYNTHTNECLKSENENTCSDNSDNCPLCTDPSFKNTKLNDIFSTNPEEKFIDNNVQSLLLNTFPKIKALAQDVNCSARNEAGDSASPLTSSDSDESIRTAKDTKKRFKRRLKDNSNAELKHDDSGYVEDDEDDDDDSLEEKETVDPKQTISNITDNKEPSNKIRKSLSSAFYESKSVNDQATHSECIPKTFEEFSSQLQKSALSEDAKVGMINKERWDIPENLSQFSAWLLDKELKKISCRDEMEKLIVDDIISLREQTIAKFLKNSCVEEDDTFKSLEKSESLTDASSLENNDTDSKVIKKSDIVESLDEQNNSKVNGHTVTEQIFDSSDKTLNGGNIEDKTEPSSEELDSDYYNYNYNSNVSKIHANDNQMTINKPEAENNALSNKLPDVISNAAALSICNSEKETKDIEHVLSVQEIDKTKPIEQNIIIYSEPISPCADSEFKNDNLNIHTTMNAEIKVEEKQECLSERQRNVDDIESEKKAKVICTTTLVTSDKEPATNNVEVNDSNTEYFAINNASNKPTSPIREVAPSAEDNLNYKKDIHSENSSLNGNILEINESENFLSVKESNAHPTFENVNNDLLSAVEMKNSFSESISCSKNKIFSSTNNTENITDLLKNDKNADENISNDERLVYTLDNYNNNTLTLVESNLRDHEVAPSFDSVKNELSDTSENEIDLMISDTRVGKGAYQGCSNEIISPEAKGVSKEVDAEKHVTSVDCHAYDELACITHPFMNDNLCTLPSSLGVENDSLSNRVISKSVTEELQHPVIALSEVSLEVDSRNISTEHSIFDAEEIPASEQDISEKDISSPSHRTEKVSEFTSSNKITDNDSLIDRSLKDNSQLNSLYKSKSVTVLQTEGIEEEDEKFPDDVNIEDAIRNTSVNIEIEKSFLTKSTNDIDRIVSIENSKNLSKLKSSDDLSIVINKEKNRDIREEYKRSRSVGRDNKEEKETFDTWNGQSKSTPDLSRCHDQQLNSSVPLSALLSKSVSQRIQDYLGKSTRGSTLNRSLPPNERSRHYRRICVSTETVVERAARFEARSKSSGRENSVDSINSINSRSGSCPPFNMRNGDVMRSVRSYAKPTATIRPTVDIYRTARDYDGKMVNGVKKSEEELFELITGYNKATKVTHKPPMPPTVEKSLKSCRLKGKIASARKEFFEKLSQQDLRSKTESNPPSLDVDVDDASTCGLRRFNEFRKSAREERARLAQSHPDLGALEAAVRSSRRRIDQLKNRRQKAPPLDAGPRPDSDASMPVTTTPTKTKDGTLVLPYRRCTGEIAWASCAKRLQEAKARSESKSQEPLEIVDERQFKRPAERPLLRAHDYENAADEDYDDPGPAISGSDFSRARSMDFLLDNREGAEPPENRLAQRVKSEHELRIERSLQNLTLPDWYTQSKKPKEGFILRRGSEGSAGESRKRWLGFSSSRTPSATSLTTPPSSYSQRNIIIPKRVTPTSGEWRYIGSLVSSRESLTPASPASLSPRECSSAAFNYGLNASLSRWSSSRLSTSSAPLTSAGVHRSFRQPYLGWRAAAASSSGGPSRSSPGASPINATTPLQGSRPGSPRRGSQDHQYGYGLQQNQITSAATLRPEANDASESGSRISPLALYDNSTNVFFNSNMEVPDFSTPEMRRDRYSYTQSLYSGTVIVSPGTEFKPVPSIAEDTSSTTDDRFSMSKSPQPPPRIWMESSFVGSKKDGKDQVHYPQGRTIRIVPSDSVRSGDRVGGSSVRSCAPQTTMGEYVLRDFRRFGITL